MTEVIRMKCHPVQPEVNLKAQELIRGREFLFLAFLLFGLGFSGALGCRCDGCLGPQADGTSND